MLTKWLYRIFLMLLILGTGQVYAETETEVRVVDFADAGRTLSGQLVKDAVPSNVVKTVTNWDRQLQELVEYPKYNNVALGKSSNGRLEAFGNEVGANVWTKETDKIFTKKYSLPDHYSFERSMTSVLNETVSKNGGKILFDIDGVNISKSIEGSVIYNPFNNLITEFELQMLLRNKSWYDNVIFHNNGVILSSEELIEKGIRLIE